MIESTRLVEGMTRAQACVRYRKKVALLARRIAERLSPATTIQYDDLVSWGAIGLLEAFDRYEEDRGVRFGTYAEHRIRGAMYDALRSQDTLSRRRRLLARRIDDTRQHIRVRLGREPIPSEIAKALSMTMEEYWKAINGTMAARKLPFDSPSEDGLSLAETIESDGRTAAEVLDAQETRQLVIDAVAKLPARHRQCVLMYYGQDMSLAEIALVYEVTISRISQILSDARKRLRKRLRPMLSDADLAAVGAA